jgi:hypothetical protein
MARLTLARSALIRRDKFASRVFRAIAAYAAKWLFCARSRGGSYRLA